MSNEKAKEFLKEQHSNLNSWSYYPPSEDRVSEIMQAYADQELRDFCNGKDLVQDTQLKQAEYLQEYDNLKSENASMKERVREWEKIGRWALRLTKNSIDPSATDFHLKTKELLTNNQQSDG